MSGEQPNSNYNQFDKRRFDYNSNYTPFDKRRMGYNSNYKPFDKRRMDYNSIYTPLSLWERFLCRFIPEKTKGERPKKRFWSKFHDE